MNEIIAAAGGTFDITDWILSIPEFAIGLFFWIVTYIGAPIESRKKGRHISGCPGVAFVCFLLAGLLSPCKWLALLCLPDFSVTAIPFFLLKRFAAKKNVKK